MKLINLGGKGTLIDQFVSELRDVKIQNDRMRFRNNLSRIGEVMAYEISKSLVFSDKNITTPLGISVMPTLVDQPVIASILRAGLPFHQGFMNFYDHAQSAFIAGYRKYDKNGNFEIEMGYITSPNIDNKEVILVDPMLATGGSFELAYNNLSRYGKPQHIHLVAIIASKEGVEFIKRTFPQNIVTLWVAAIDDGLTVKSYIVPGLGDAGDLAFGEKVDY